MTKSRSVFSRSLGAAALSLWTTGCGVTWLGGGPQLSVPYASVTAQTRAASDAHVRLESAVRHRDVAAIEALLSPNAEVVTLRGDVARGEAAARYLASLNTDAIRLVSLMPAKRDLCVEGGLHEYDGELAGVPSGERISGKYSIFWSTDSQPARAKRIVLTYGDSSLRSVTRCAPEFAYSARLHRTTITLAGAASAVRPSSATRSAADVARANGYTWVSPIRVSAGPAREPFPQIDASGLAFTIGLRQRVTRTLSAEVQLGLQRTDSVVGFDSKCLEPPCESPVSPPNAAGFYAVHNYVSMTTKPVTASLLVQRQGTNWRVGVGPSVVFGRWMVREDNREMNLIEYRAQGSYAQSVFPKSAITGVRSNTALAPAFGAAAEVSAYVPVSRVLLGEVYLRGAAYSSTTLPETPNFSNVQVTNYAIQAGLSFGIGWR